MSSLLLFFVTAASAAPVWVGIYYTADYNGVFTAYDTSLPRGDSATYVITYRAAYNGVGIEAEYGPFWILRSRFRIAELQFFPRARGQLDPARLGGRALVLFPALGADISLEPPFRWRVLPYIWGGLSITVYGGNPELPDPRFFFGPEIHARAGIGIRYRLRQGIDLAAETQWFAHDTYRNLFPDNIENAGGQLVVQSVALNRIQLGIRVSPKIKNGG